MKHIAGTKALNVKHSVAVLGNLDGVHLGHRLLIDKAKSYAKGHHLESLVFSFNKHPSHIINDKESVPLIYTSKEKKEIIENLGIDVFVEYPFNLAVSTMEPEVFIKEVVVNQLDAKVVIVGKDYGFGINRRGDIHLLERLSKSYGFELMIIPKLTYKNRIISSTWIREELLNGQLQLVNHLLGNPFFIHGCVVKGKQFGRTMGFPTANIRPKPEKVLPPNGVYVSKVYFEDSQFYGLTNIGINPTMNGTSKVVETYILNFNKIIYGKQLKVELIQYLRKEKKFQSTDALKAQITNDKHQLMEIFNVNTCPYKSSYIQ